MKKLFALVLAFCLVLTMLPAPAFAEGEPEVVCTCETACTEELKNTDCPVCGAEGATLESCGKYEPQQPQESEEPATPEEPEKPTEPTPAQKVQTLINALPDTVTAENRETVEAQLTAIDDAKLPLSDEERDTLDFGKYNAAITALNALDGQPGAEKPEVLSGYTVELDPNGGRFEYEASPYFVIINEEGKIEYGDLSTPIWDGYNFVGWYTAAEGGKLVTKDSNFEEIKTIYAHWKKGHTITFDPKGGELDANKTTATADIDGMLSTTPTPTREDYLFGGWYYDEAYENKYKDSDSFTEDTTLYARWLNKVTQVNFFLSGYGYGKSIPDIQLTSSKSNQGVICGTAYGEDYFIASAHKEGSEAISSGTFGQESKYYLHVKFQFQEGWSVDIYNNTPPIKLDGVKAVFKNFDIEKGTVYVVFQLPAIVIFDANGGTLPDGVANTATTNAEGKLASLPTPARDGYRFDGWYTEKVGGDKVTTDKEYSKNTTLYAHWTVLVEKVSLTYSGHAFEKKIDNVTVTAQTTGITFLDASYGGSWGITKDKPDSQTLPGGLFKADTQYYLWVTFSPKEGCTLEGLTKENVRLDGTAALSLTLNGGLTDDGERKPETATAVFRLPVIYTVTIEVGKNGSVSSDSTINAKGVITVFEGENVALKITPDSGYVVYRLTVDGTNEKTARSYTFENVQKSHTLKVSFLKNGTNAKTGDSFPLVPAIAVLALSAAALVAVVVIAKKKKK